MIFLITGSPGSGKSLYTVSNIIPSLLRDGRTIYTNLIDLKYHNEEVIHGQTVLRNLVKVKDDLPVWELIKPLPDSKDWRDVPFGSVIIYDEAQQFFPASGRVGLSNDPVITDLDTHRHKGYDIYYITQHPTLINSHIRKFVGSHIHLYRKFGANHSTIFEWFHCVGSPENEIGAVQKSIKNLFRFNKKSYSYYKSSELHTAKKRYPKKLFIFPVIILLILFFAFKVGLSAYDSIIGFKDDMSFSDKVVEVEDPLKFMNKGYTVTPAKDKAKDLSCSIVGDSCSCVDVSGSPVDVPKAQCLSSAIINF